jgi:hypothetical protein
MKKIVTLSLLTATVLLAGGELTPVEPIVVTEDTHTLSYAFANGELSGQIRAGYINFNPEVTGPTNYTTALGGQLKYETARYYGFHAGAAFYTSHAITGLSGNKRRGKFNYELAGDNHYDTLAEAYIGYKYESFEINGGRILIDTPYADSDDIRMTPNTFEGVMATYSINDTFSLIGAYVTRWQGPDAESYDFVDLLGSNANGVAIAALTYASDHIEASLWYYGADKTADIVYADVLANYEISEGVELLAGLQYAKQNERSHSGIGGTLYGAMAEVSFSGLSLSAAYDELHVGEFKEYFGGFGGGVAFVNLNETTAGVIAVQQGVEAVKLAVVYDLAEVGANGFSAEYNYGDFEGKEHGHFIEQNMILAYTQDEAWNIEAIYAHIHDELTGLEDEGFDRFLVRANYNF